jgi:hypothetical protein
MTDAMMADLEGHVSGVDGAEEQRKDLKRAVDDQEEENEPNST